MKLSVKKGDNVIVLTGKDKGKKGKIISADPDAGKVRVENVNMASKHKKPRSAQDAGGIIKMEGVIDASNVQILCPSCNERTRVGHTIGEKGKKIRQCKKCGASLDVKIEKTKKTAKKDKTDKKKNADVKEESVAGEVKTEKKTTAKKSTAKKETETKTAKKEKPADKE